MDRTPILLIGETPGLADAVAELLEGEGLRTHCVRSSRDALTEQSQARDRNPPLIIVVSNSFHSEATARWQRGELRSQGLVLVGTRDPFLRTGGGLHVISLPLVPDRLVALVRALAGQPSAGPRVEA
ncbi:MAG TPA: hypothetical protein VGX00_00585 [Thermoplasmata archaeon]|nr:hypothetical protein [Thermoplasmata archaeon]